MTNHLKKRPALKGKGHLTAQAMPGNMPRHVGGDGHAARSVCWSIRPRTVAAWAL